MGIIVGLYVKNIYLVPNLAQTNIYVYAHTKHHVCLPVYMFYGVTINSPDALRNSGTMEALACGDWPPHKLKQGAEVRRIKKGLWGIMQ